MKHRKTLGPDTLDGCGPLDESVSADSTTSSYLASDNKPRKILDDGGKMIALSIDLAAKVGVIDAAILQQMSYLTYIAPDEGHWFGGKKWIWNSAHQWHRQLPFLSEKSIANHLVQLEKKGLIYSRQPGAYDRTKHYAIDYVAVDQTIGHVTRTGDASSAAGSSISGDGTMDEPPFGRSTNKENAHMVIKEKEVISFG